MSHHPHAGWPQIELRTIGIRAVHLPPDWARPTSAASPHGGTGILPVFAPPGTTMVIMAGLAGALDPSLQIGDVIIDAASDKLPNGLNLRRGRIHTADQLIATPAQKAALFRETGALVVDMENAIVRTAANAAGIPFIGIRAVSDTADQALDPAVLNLVDDLGRLRPAALAGTLLRRPALIPYLNRLGTASRLAADRLAQAVSDLLDAGILDESE
jgi:hypothetical protein